MLLLTYDFHNINRLAVSIQYAILGYLSWRSSSGYDLKKFFARSETQYWSGNNNQIYTALVKLHNAGLVTKEVQFQADHPLRKVYTITPVGQAELKKWLLSTPDLPALRNPLHIQLAWAEQLSDSELDQLLASYEEELRIKVLMLQEQAKQDQLLPNRSRRETFLWQEIAANRLSFYEDERRWAQKLRAAIGLLDDPMENQP